LIDTFIWFITVELLSLIALPATFVLFRSLPDRGYAFGKAISILIISFLLWLAAYAHILPNTQWAIILIIALLAAGSLFIFIRRRQQLVSFVSENRRVIIATEAVFLLAFILMAVVRAYDPAIDWGEKPMDFAFLNGILRSEYFPPLDPWLSGHSISYYYFGYLMMATLTKLTGISSAVTFNLSIALIFALTAIGAFSIVYNLIKLRRGGNRAAIGFGLVAVGLLLILGNLEGVLEILHAHGFGSQGFWEWVGIAGLEGPEGLGNPPYYSAHWYPADHLWWWRATRIINTLVPGEPWGLDYTITEFPSFSFLFADLHPHLMALPFVLLNVAFCLEIINSPDALGLAWLKRNWPKFLVFAICLGALGFINTWDFPTYIFLFALVALIGAYLARGKIDTPLIKDVGIFCAALLACSLLIYLPFYVAIESEVKGFGLVDNIATWPFHFIIFWGVFLFITVSFVFAQAWNVLRRRNLSRWEITGVISIPLLPLLIWAVWALATGLGFLSILEKFGHILPLLLVISLILFILIKKSQRAAKFEDNGNRSTLFVFVLLFIGFMLLMGLELFFVRDPNGIRRMNTMFKIYYQVWVFMAIASAFGLYWLSSRGRPVTIVNKISRASWWTVCALLLAGSLIYPIAATIDFTTGFGGEPTLNGLAFLERNNPSEYEAIAWLNAEVGDAPVIVEALDGDCTNYSRVSSRTGLPTILGCPGHESLWRGGSDFPERREDINLIYNRLDIDLVKELLAKYNATYVYVGHLERAQYGYNVGEKFTAFMDVAFENEGVTIYKVREE
jgi:YYY domain-containing protein